MGKVGVPAAFGAIVPIDATMSLDGFRSGEDSLDHWLRQRALKSEGRTARTYVICPERSVVGYYAVSAGSLRLSALPGKIRRNAPDPTPALLIGRLAVSLDWQGRGVGSALLRDALRRCAAAAGMVGARGVLIHALSPAAAEFYRRLGFIILDEQNGACFIPMETLQAALAGG